MSSESATAHPSIYLEMDVHREAITIALLQSVATKPEDLP
jgi:hypothetical protein